MVAAVLWGVVFVVALPESPDPTDTMADLAASLWVVVGFVAWMVVYVGQAMMAKLGIQWMWALVVLVMVPVGFVIWTIFDARKLCKAYNAVMDETGRPPWQTHGAWMLNTHTNPELASCINRQVL